MQAQRGATHQRVQPAAAQAAPQAVGGTSQSRLQPAATTKLLTESCNGATQTGRLACRAAAAGAGEAR
jgi:hypothetical protein